MAFATRWRERAHQASNPESVPPAAIREQVVVEGVVEDVQALERGEVYDLVVTLSGQHTALVWWGLAAIPGITAGTYIRAQGRPSVYRGRLALLNPPYELGSHHGCHATHG